MTIDDLYAALRAVQTGCQHPTDKRVPMLRLDQSACDACGKIFTHTKE